jgi:hypothetical protein
MFLAVKHRDEQVRSTRISVVGLHIINLSHKTTWPKTSFGHLDPSQHFSRMHLVQGSGDMFQS